MELVNIKKLEDCFDGGVIFEYTFDEKIQEGFMKKLSGKGKLDYFPEFAKPFFKIFSDKGLQIKGIIGENNIEVTFPVSEKWERKIDFEAKLKNNLIANG